MSYRLFCGFLLSDRGSRHTCSDNICEHNCTNLPDSGLICSCRPGYRSKATEKHNCEGKGLIHRKKRTGNLFPRLIQVFLILLADVNECEVYGTCPQECKNTKGSYECFCADGFLSVGEPHGAECAAQGESSTVHTHRCKDLCKMCSVLN